MKRFIKKALLLLVMIVTTVVPLFLMPGYPAHYLAADIEKILLLKNTASPKIVFVGGSNLAFGLDSEQITKVFNCNVINMGLHGGLGLRFMLEEVKPYIKKKDTVIVVPEYDDFLADAFDGDDTLLQLIYINPSAIKYLSLKQLINIIPKWNFYEKVFMGPESVSDIYCRGAFNQYGDVTSHLAEVSPGFKELPNLVHKINKNAVGLLTKFIISMQDRGVIVYISFPCFPQSAYIKYGENISFLYQHFQNNIRIQMLNSPSDYIFVDNLFFDTPYHLNTVGREIRTRKLIEDLKNKNVGAREASKNNHSWLDL